jgi:hypothetical protein
VETVAMILPDDPSAQVRSVKQSPFGREEFVLASKAHNNIPYDPHLDSMLEESLFETGMVGVHSRETVINAEPYWGHHLLVFETSLLGDKSKIVRYWKSRAAKDARIREEIRELVSVLGVTMFEIAIFL